MCASTWHNPPVPASARGTFTNPWAGTGRVPVAYCGRCAALLGSISPAGEPLFRAEADALLADLTRVVDVEVGLRDVLDRPRPGGAP